MIFGRPTNLWLGFSTAVVGFASLVAVSAFKADAEVVATLAGGLQLLLGAGIALVAGQPPTLNVGDTYQVTTPPGQETQTQTVRDRAIPSGIAASPVPDQREA